MSCYNPASMLRIVDPLTGEVIWRFLGTYNPKEASINNEKGYSEGDVVPRIYKIPCGKCIGCKLDYARRWADRLLMELDTYKGKAIFITLTYAEPPTVEYEGQKYFTLEHKDFQDFMKRLRSYFPRIKMKFFMCGEYGSPLKTFRPHYHAIIYGLTVDDFPNRRKVDENELHQISYSDKILEDRWKHGLISFSEVTYATMSYVSRYSAKKVFGNNQKPCPMSKDSYVMMSRKSGIAKDFLKTHDFHGGKYSLCDGKKIIDVYWPKYGNKILDFKDTEEYAMSMRNKVDSSVSKELMKLSKTDLSYHDMLKVEEHKKFDRVKRIFIERKEL